MIIHIIYDFGTVRNVSGLRIRREHPTQTPILHPWWRLPTTSSKKETPAASLDNHAKAIVEITGNAVSEGLVPGTDLADVWADIFRLENRFKANVNHIMLAVVSPGDCGHPVQAAVGTRERPQPLPRVEVVRDRGQGARQRIGPHSTNAH